MKARITFDTLAYANRLKAAGLESKIAETQAAANAEMLASLMEGTLVTKQDLIGFATKEDLVDLATKQDLIQLETKMDARFEHMEARFEHIESRFTHIDSKLEHYATKEDLAHLESKVDRLGLQLTLRLGGLVLSCLAGITAILSFFHGLP